MMSVGTSYDFQDESRKLPDGHMFDEAVIIDPVGAGFYIFSDFLIF